MTAHKHAALMLQYAQDAAETDRPWERWEWWYSSANKFVPCCRHPSWNANYEFRRKSQVTKVTVNGKRMEFPRPLQTVPSVGTKLYYPDTLGGRLALFEPVGPICVGEDFGIEWMEQGIYHLTREAAQAHADVLNAVCRGDIE